MRVLLRVALVMMVAIVVSTIQFEPAFGVTANSDLLQYEQPNGTIISYRVRGDENANWKESKDGAVILRDDMTGYYCYAKRILNKIYKSNAKVGIDKKPALTAKSKDAIALFSAPASGDGQTPEISMSPAFSYTEGTSLPATQPTLVLIINYSNVKSTAPAGHWANAIFSPIAKSVNSYYKEVSYGATSIVPVAETGQTDNDGVVTVTLPSDHPCVDGYSDEANALVPGDVRYAMSLANSSVNFANYDRDGDGVVTSDELHIVAVFAGGEAAVGGDKNSIWAHAWGYNTLTVDGVDIEHYIAFGENFGDEYGVNTEMTIGVICHELGHSMGLPDLYDYGYDSQGVGIHSLMAGGSWGRDSWSDELPGETPVHLDAWSKITLGFVDPTTAVTGTQYLMNQTFSSKYNVLKVNISSKPKQYFLVENRQFAGFDQGLSSELGNEGVVIYHIDEEVMEYSQNHPNDFSSMNDNRFRKAVDVEEANSGIIGHDELNYYGSDPLTDINPAPGAWSGKHCFALGDNTRYNRIFGGATSPSSNAYTNVVGETIIPPLVHDATGDWYFETNAQIGAQTTPSNIKLDVLDSAQASMRVGYNVVTHLISTVASPTSGGAISGGIIYIKGATATLKATPSKGYYFSRWTQNGTTVSTQNPHAFTVTENKALTAVFALTSFKINYALNGGTNSSINPASFTIKSGTITLASPKKQGYAFLGWYKTSTYTGTAVKTIPSGSSAAITLYAKWGAPIVSARSNSYTSIKVSWAYASGTTSYRIYRATSATGPYSFVYAAASTARSWVDTGQTTGRYYYYKVYPVAGGKTYAFSTYKYAKAIPATPTVSLSEYNNSSIKISWNSVSGASGYQIYRAYSSTGTYTYQKTVSASTLSWINTSRTPGQTYYYKVRAYHLEGTTKVYGVSSVATYIKM